MLRNRPKCSDYVLSKFLLHRTIIKLELDCFLGYSSRQVRVDSQEAVTIK